jgi:lipopolysaccharide transport system ATP-binding protein
MGDTVIHVENLSKKYVLSHQQDRNSHKTLRDAIATSAASLLNPIQNPKSVRLSGSAEAHPRSAHDEAKIQNSSREEFWALKDVNFEIQQGDRVGIIGRNGAGKSTLLKILSRIVEPTSGRIRIKGRVASLLEVGTGFHPELTGRENIFLNGAILGMSKAEIQRKFDEIVAFAEIEKFLDTPVKRYSSGMYVRLAFAVAAHLEPEVLIVDEVLAVGDTAFQKKCLGKMEEVGKDGRTVLFVSHNMATIEKLCSHGIYLNRGRVKWVGTAHQAICNYLDDTRGEAKISSLRERQDRQGSGRVRIVGFRVLDDSGQEQRILQSGKNYIFKLEYEKDDFCGSLKDVIGSIGIADNTQNIVLLVRSSFTNENFTLDKKLGSVECYVKDFSLATGVYHCMLFLSYRETEVLDLIESAAEITVEGGDFFGTGSMGLPSHCKVLTRAEWRAR